MLDIAIVAAGMMGALAGFLWWNAAPARIFMGDTGSLAIGGLVRCARDRHEHPAPARDPRRPVRHGDDGVILQVISFRGFGRRIFRMSPIHHHFELAGWPEFTVIVRFWIIAGLCVAVGLGLYYADFISSREGSIDPPSQGRAGDRAAGAASAVHRRPSWVRASPGRRPRGARGRRRLGAGDRGAARRPSCPRRPRSAMRASRC